MATIGLTDEEREDIRFALAREADWHEARAGEDHIGGQVAAAAHARRAEALRALARKVTACTCVQCRTIAPGDRVRHRGEGWTATVLRQTHARTADPAGEAFEVRRDDTGAVGLTSAPPLELV